MNISIIIPTFNRFIILNKILNNLNRQLEDFKNEVIICDSFSTDGTRELFNGSNKLFKNLNIIYRHNISNNLSAKRNEGIILSKYNNLILLDDDCIPLENFINDYCEVFRKASEKDIFSGLVVYDENHLKKSNYLKFKSSRHFNKEFVSKEKALQTDQIVAMNMGIIKNSFFVKSKLFDEGFTGYGFEDYEFAFRLKNYGFNLKTCNAKILHDEGAPNFKFYLKKYYFLGKDGMQNLKKINFEAAKKTIYFKIENNLLIKFFFKLKFFKGILKYLQKVFIKIDNKNLISFFCFYQICRLNSYLLGCFDRNIVNNNNFDRYKDWYE